MKKAVQCVLIVLLCACMIASSLSISTAESVTVSFEVDSYSVSIGKSITLKPIISPRGNMKLEWYSSNDEIATVSAKGVVNGISIGDVIITVRAEDDESLSASCKVSVIQPVQKISFTAKSIELPIGVPKKLSAIVEPENATYKDLAYSSSNEKVAVVDDSGMVVGVSKGTAKITAISKDGSKKSAVINVKIGEYDMVFLSIRPQKTYYSYKGTGNVKIRGKVKNDNVSVKRLVDDIESWKKLRKDIDRDFWMSGSEIEWIEVVPLQPGIDEITIKINNHNLKWSVYVADFFEDYENQYIPVPDTKPDEKNGAFRDIIYGTSYSDVINQMVALYGSDYMVEENDAGRSVEFKNADITVAGHSVEALNLWFCNDEDEKGYIITTPDNSSFYKASYVIKETNCEQDFLDDYVLGDNSITEDLFNKLTDVYGKANLPFDLDDVSDGWTIRWEDNQTDIELEYNNQNREITVTYTWSPGYLKHSKLEDTIEYLEERKKKEEDKTEYDSSTDGL